MRRGLERWAGMVMEWQAEMPLYLAGEGQVETSVLGQG